MDSRMLTRLRTSNFAKIINVDNQTEQPGHVFQAVLAAENPNFSQSIPRMAPRNQTGDEVRKMKKREWHKTNRERIKSDPVLLERLREKERQRYKMKLEKKQLKLVRDMTAREHRAQKIKWRKRARQAYARKKQRSWKNGKIQEIKNRVESCVFLYPKTKNGVL